MDIGIIKKVRTDAEKMFESGSFYCSEAIVASVRKNMAEGMSEQLITASSGFPLGVGGSKCMCGAVSGAVICLGYFFGRVQPSDPKIQKCLALADELQASFREKHNVLCCNIHTQDVELGSEEQLKQCISFTGEMAEKVAEIIFRELVKEIK